MDSGGAEEVEKGEGERGSAQEWEGVLDGELASLSFPFVVRE
jgi:hypothetical protein